MKLKLSIALLALTMLTSISSYAQTLNGFSMYWLFCNADGTNMRSVEDACECQTVYIKNLSSYGNPSGGSSIGTALTTGQYKVTHYPSGCQIALIDAADWPGGGVASFNVPCSGTTCAFTNPGWIYNLRIEHIGPGTATSPCTTCLEYHTNGLKPWPKPTVIAAPDTTICSYHQVTLNASGTADSWLWTPGGYTSSSVIIYPSSTTSFSLTGSKTYTGKDPHGSWDRIYPTCSNSDNATVTVLTGPALHLNNHYLCSGDPMPVLDAGSTPVSYQWTYMPAGSTTPVPAGFSQYCNTATYGYGFYTVTVYGANGCATTKTVEVGLLPSASGALDAGFGLSTNVSGSTYSINATANDPTGDHWWGLFLSDDSCTNGLFPAEPPQTGPTASWSESLVTSGQHYKVIHHISKAPCNEIKEGYTCFSQTPVFGIIVYPNPTTGIFDVALQQYDPKEIYTGFITDRWGTVIQRFKFPRGQYTMKMDISKYKNGPYIVVVQDSHMTAQEKRVIKAGKPQR